MSKTHNSPLFSQYVQDAQTQAFEGHHAFFAFGNKQLEEALEKVRPHLQEGEKVSQLGGGLFCPKFRVGPLIEALDKAAEAAVEQIKKEWTKKEIIRAQLVNHEYGYTLDPSDAAKDCEQFGYTSEEVAAEGLLMRAEGVFDNW